MTRPKGEKPPERRIIDRWRAEGNPGGGRDMRPAVGTRGAPARWKRARETASVALAKRDWGDARWSYLYRRGGSNYADVSPNGTVDAAARRMRDGTEVTVDVQGPVINPPVWTWEVPVYFWVGGLAMGSSFVAVAADAAGDEKAARVARTITLGVIAPGVSLLIADLGRPERFLHMMRILKVRSPMSLGAWTLGAFSNVALGAAAADYLERPAIARASGIGTALMGTYLGSYTGALLASTAVPVWARSRVLLGPIFVSTGVATGAAANRLALAATGTPHDAPTRVALKHVETGAMVAELVLSAVNERRLGRLGEALEHGRPGQCFKWAKAAVVSGLALRTARRPEADHLSSLLFLGAGLAFRIGWVEGGKASARDHRAVAEMARRS